MDRRNLSVIYSIGTMGIPHVWHEPGLSWKGRKEGGGFSAQFSGIIIFSMELYYSVQLCSRYMTETFISYPVNNIQAYKYNILMALQSAIASTVTVIAGILVCIVVRLSIGLPPVPWPCVLYFCVCECFEKLTKLVT